MAESLHTSGRHWQATLEGIGGLAIAKTNGELSLHKSIISPPATKGLGAVDWPAPYERAFPHTASKGLAWRDPGGSANSQILDQSAITSMNLESEGYEAGSGYLLVGARKARALLVFRNPNGF
jgi:hypothetical protein